MAQHKLTDIAVRMLKPKSSSFQVSDGGGLYLKIYPNGAKSWLLRKYSDGKQTSLMLGTYPDMSLAQARKAAAKELDKIKLKQEQATANSTIGEIIAEWLETKDVRPATQRNIRFRLNKLEPYKGLVFEDFTTPMARALVRDVVRNCGAIAGRHLASTIAQIERYAYSIGVVDTPRLQLLSVMVKRPAIKHCRTVSADRLPELVAIMHEHATTPARCAMVKRVKLLMLTLLRSNEAVNLRWEWVDFKTETITIPANRMKGKRDHRLPISTALKKLLLSLEPKATGPVLNSKTRSPTGPAQVFRWVFNSLGIIDLISPHGVRSMGRTWFAEQDFNFVHCEYCLAHRVENHVQLSYQRSDYLEQRRPIMEAWGDYVESCFDPYFPDL